MRVLASSMLLFEVIAPAINSASETKPLAVCAGVQGRSLDGELLVRLSHSQAGQPCAPGREEGPVGSEVAEART